MLIGFVFVSPQETFFLEGSVFSFPPTWNRCLPVNYSLFPLITSLLAFFSAVLGCPPDRPTPAFPLSSCPVLCL